MNLIVKYYLMDSKRLGWSLNSIGLKKILTNGNSMILTVKTQKDSFLIQHGKLSAHNIAAKKELNISNRTIRMWGNKRRLVSRINQCILSLRLMVLHRWVELNGNKPLRLLIKQLQKWDKLIQRMSYSELA